MGGCRYHVGGCTRWGAVGTRLGAVPGGGLYQVGDCIPYIEANKIKIKTNQNYWYSPPPGHLVHF